MEKVQSVRNRDDVVRLVSAALRHEWAVSLEYVVHAYSMPKGKFLYEDPVLKQTTDARAQTIQIGIDEMYHALQLGVILTEMGAEVKVEELIAVELANKPGQLQQVAKKVSEADEVVCWDIWK